MAKPIPLTLVRSDEPVRAPEPGDALRVLEVAAVKGRAGVRGAMATVVARRGSAPATPGQKLYVGADRTCVGTVGGGAIEREVLAELERALVDRDALHSTRTFKLGAELGMCCGGSVDVAIERIEALVPCLVVGGGHVATATAPLLATLGFAVTVCDERDAWSDEGRLEGVRCVSGSWTEAAREMPADGVVLVMTHDHALDQQAIEWALAKRFAFVGGIGSRAKAQRTRDRLEAKGFSKEDQGRVRMPIGVDIGARLPQEIAVSIAAELVQWRRSRGGV